MIHMYADSVRCIAPDNTYFVLAPKYICLVFIDITYVKIIFQVFHLSNLDTILIPSCIL